MSKKSLSLLVMMLIICALLTSCAAWNYLSKDEASKEGSDSREMETTGQDTVTQEGEEMYQDTSEDVVYLAGGCFWGLEALMQSIPGVIDAESGYANGTCEADANYRSVCAGNTGFRETVRVAYDPQKVSLDALLLAYFYVIDPTVKDRQGNDRGSQYQTGIYYTNERNGRTHRGNRAPTQREIFCRDRASKKLLSRGSVSSGLLKKESKRVLPYSEGRNEAFFGASRRSGRLQTAGRGGGSAKADQRAISRYAGKRHREGFYGRILE